MAKQYQPQFKAIETKYDGYHFRSRLEARWAVFFKTLGIDYHYEPEGYILNGEPYLPDFWLPEQKCFIEIKGQAPTEKEREKVQLLAMYTHYEACIIYGNINFPSTLYDHGTYYIYPGALVEYYKHPSKASTYKIVEVSGEASYLLQLLAQGGIRPCAKDGKLFFEYDYPPFSLLEHLSMFSNTLAEQCEIMRKADMFIAKNMEELKKIFIPSQTDAFRKIEQNIIFDEGSFTIVECSSCHQITLGQHHASHDCSEDSEMVCDSPRLLVAYTAAREARFER